MKQGMSESVKLITVADIKKHYNKYFTKNNLMIGIAGNYSDDFVKMLKSDMQKLSSEDPIPAETVKANIPEGIQMEIIQKDNAFGSAIFAGFPLAITRADDDFAALVVANSYLGEHRKSYSKLYRLIRETRSMNYGDYSYIEWYENGVKLDSLTNQLEVTFSRPAVDDIKRYTWKVVDLTGVITVAEDPLNINDCYEGVFDWNSAFYSWNGSSWDGPTYNPEDLTPYDYGRANGPLGGSWFIYLGLW